MEGVLKDTAQEGRLERVRRASERGGHGVELLEKKRLRPSLLPSHAYPQPALEVSEDEGVRLLRLQ